MFYLKKIIAAVVLFGLLFTGCTNTDLALNQGDRSLDKLEKSFTATAKIDYRDVKAEVEIDRNEPKSYTMTFTEPSSVKDLKLVFTEEKVDIFYKAMNMSVKPESFSDGAVGKMLMSTLERTAGAENLRIESSDGVVTISGSVEGGEYVLRLDEKTANFLSLSLPESDFYMEFTGFEFY